MPRNVPGAIASSAKRTKLSALTRTRRRPELLIGVGFGRQDRHGLAAAAGFCLIGIAEDKSFGELVALEIHFRPNQKHDRFRIDQDTNAFVLDDFIERSLGLGIV